jgi:hypothetical protein
MVINPGWGYQKKISYYSRTKALVNLPAVRALGSKKFRHAGAGGLRKGSDLICLHTLHF